MSKLTPLLKQSRRQQSLLTLTATGLCAQGQSLNSKDGHWKMISSKKDLATNVGPRNKMIVTATTAFVKTAIMAMSVATTAFVATAGMRR